MENLTAVLTLALSLQAPAADDDPVAMTQSWIAQITRIEKPELLRILDAAAWRAFWKTHTKSDAQPPDVSFWRRQMLLVLPTPTGARSDGATTVEARKSSESLKIRLTLDLKPAGDKPQTLVTLIVLPRSSLPVDFLLRTGSDPSALPFISGGKLEGVAGAVTLKGKLQFLALEGGTWALVHDGKTYDLHGDLNGFKAGDEVEIFGQIPTCGACIHAYGTVFDVEGIRAAKK